MTTTGNTDLDGFIDAYTPEVAATAYACFDKLRARIGGATIMAYDYYNALAIGWSPDDHTPHGILSLALYPRWINLCFLRGSQLPDPHGLLQGSGNQVRTIRLLDASMLDDPRIDLLIADAVQRSEPPVDPAAPARIIIKGVSAKKRPRRPA
jgi:hypothetical protein